VEAKLISPPTYIEMCMLNLKTTSVSSHIMVVYRAPAGNFNLFLNRLDDSITCKSIYRADLNLILCSDMNIDYPLTMIEKDSLTQYFKRIT